MAICRVRRASPRVSFSQAPGVLRTGLNAVPIGDCLFRRNHLKMIPNGRWPRRRSRSGILPLQLVVCPQHDVTSHWRPDCSDRPRVPPPRAKGHSSEEKYGDGHDAEPPLSSCWMARSLTGNDHSAHLAMAIPKNRPIRALLTQPDSANSSVKARRPDSSSAWSANFVAFELCVLEEAQRGRKLPCQLLCHQRSRRPRSPAPLSLKNP